MWWLAFKAWIHVLANEHKLFRRSVLVWACLLITWATYTVFTKPPNMSNSDAVALGSVIGILTVVIGFYFKHRGGDADK